MWKTGGDWNTKIKYKTSEAWKILEFNLTTFSSGISYSQKFWSPFDFPKEGSLLLTTLILNLSEAQFFGRQNQTSMQYSPITMWSTYNIWSTWWGKAIWISDPQERLSRASSSSGPWNMESVDIFVLGEDIKVTWRLWCAQNCQQLRLVKLCIKIFYRFQVYKMSLKWKSIREESYFCIPLCIEGYKL